MSIKIQTQNSLFRFRNVKWLLGSVLLHVVIIAGLLFGAAFVGGLILVVKVVLAGQ